MLAAMDDLDRSILLALAYAGAFPWPLTLIELYERIGEQRYALGEIASRVDLMVTNGSVRCEHGFYSFSDVSAGVAWRRVCQQKECAQKWTRMLYCARRFRAVPYVRMIAASGSLALGNTDADSDWDMFVIAQAGRLYTARAGMLLAAWCEGRLRTKRMRTAPDKFCFNHFIATDCLAIKHRSIFVTHALAELVPMYDDLGFLPRLWQANRWISEYRLLPKYASFVRRSVAPSRALGIFRHGVELLLDTWIGDGVERALRAWMQRRIAREPATHERGGRVVSNDCEIEFHPRSFEAIVLSRYNAALVRMGLGQNAERDSGLVH